MGFYKMNAWDGKTVSQSDQELSLYRRSETLKMKWCGEGALTNRLFPPYVHSQLPQLCGPVIIFATRAAVLSCTSALCPEQLLYSTMLGLDMGRCWPVGHSTLA